MKPVVLNLYYKKSDGWKNKKDNSVTYRPENGKGHGDGNRSKNKPTVTKNVL